VCADSVALAVGVLGRIGREDGLLARGTGGGGPALMNGRGGKGAVAGGVDEQVGCGCDLR